jgi:undecaprenyl-diphosphatase
MNDLLRAIILGALQGVTEFLPISSSAHLIIVPWLFGWEPYGLAFDVSLHLGTLAAVLTYFFHDLKQMALGALRALPGLARGRLPDDPMARLGLYVVPGTIPAAVVGLLAEDAIETYFHQEPLSRTALLLLTIMLILLGLLLGAADRYGRRNGHREVHALRLRDAVIVGVAQAFALLPGVSRSGSTITAGLFSGMSRPVAARFSFLLGVPIVFGAGMMGVLDLIREGIPAGERDAFFAGVLTAAIVGYAAVAGLMRFLQHRSTDVFVVYRVLLGVGMLILLAFGFRS